MSAVLEGLGSDISDLVLSREGVSLFEKRSNKKLINSIVLMSVQVYAGMENYFIDAVSIPSNGLDYFGCSDVCDILKDKYSIPSFPYSHEKENGVVICR